MLSPNYYRLEQIIGRHAKHWGLMLHLMDNWDTNKTPMENVEFTAEFVGIETKTACKYVLRSLSDLGLSKIDDLRKVM